jgi:hypothetical protein
MESSPSVIVGSEIEDPHLDLVGNDPIDHAVLVSEP